MLCVALRANIAYARHRASDPFPCLYRADQISSPNSLPPALSPTTTTEDQSSEERITGSSQTAGTPAASPAAVVDNSTQYYCAQITTPSGFTHTYTPPNQFPRRLIAITSSTAPAHRVQARAPEAAPAVQSSIAGTGSSPLCTEFTTASGFTYTYTSPASQLQRLQAASSSAAPTHRAQVQAARAVPTDPGSITDVFEKFLDTNRRLVAQHRSQTQELKQVLEQQAAEIRLLHDEREALFHFRPLRKRKREGENQQGDSGLPRNFFGQRPNLSPFLRLPQHQYLQEPQGQDTWRITDKYGPIDYDTGVSVNIENNLHRFVGSQAHLYPLECTNLLPTLDTRYRNPSSRASQEYFVNTPGGPVRVYGYGLAQAIVPFPNDRWGLVAYWAYYAPQAEASYRTRYGLLGSSIRHIAQHGAPNPPDRGSASGESTA